MVRTDGYSDSHTNESVWERTPSASTGVRIPFPPSWSILTDEHNKDASVAIVLW
jgi:hypothetical protein